MNQLKLFNKFRSPGLLSSYLRLLIFWNPVITLGFCLLYMGFGPGFLRQWAESDFIASFISTVCFLSIRLARRFKLIPGVAHHGVSYVLSFLVSIPAYYLASSVSGVFHRWMGWPWHVSGSEGFRTSIVIGAMISAIFFLTATRRKALDAANAAEVGKLQAQVAALTSQMNPHLLFNSLNTVAELVYSDPRKAEATIVKLSELYRAVLGSTQRSTHALAEELELCMGYLEIERARFGERLRTDFQIDPEIDAARVQVPVLSLQPLIENAVKHGIASRASGGMITVRVSNRAGAIEIEVGDDGVGFGNSTREGSGTGVSNCRRRLELTYGASASLEVRARQEGGTSAYLRFPTEVRG